MSVGTLSLASVNILKNADFSMVQKFVKIQNVMQDLAVWDILEYANFIETTIDANLENGVVLSMLRKIK